MSDYRRGDERIMRVTEVNRGQTTWVRVGDLVRCGDGGGWAGGGPPPPPPPPRRVLPPWKEEG